MKNFSKKLSFVMATAMVVTSLYAPQGAEAAATNKIVVKNGKHAVKTKNIYIGGKVVDFDAVVKGKPVKDSKGTWKSSNKKIASVDKNGKVKALKNGKVTISFKTKATKKVKSVTVKMTINARTRASKMILTPAAVVVKEGEKATVGVSYEISKKIQAAGGKTTTYKLFAESSDEKAAKVSVEGDDKIVVEGVAKSATPVSITVYAAQVTNIAKAKEVRIKLTEKFDVKVNSKFDAKQVKVNKILVTGTNLSTKAAAYVVKNVNGIVLNLKDKVEVNKEGTEATLEAVVNQIPEGKYTVTYDKEDPAEFTAVKQVLDKIVIEPADKLILKGITDPENKVAYAYYKALDNFGEDVTEQPLGANIYANGKPVAKKGEVEFKQDNAFLLGSTFSLVLVDQNSGKTATANLTVSRESMLTDVMVKGVYDKKNKKVVESLGERADLEDYVLLFEGKDQYGRVKNNIEKLQATIGGSTGLQVKTGKVDQVKIDGVEYMTLGLTRFTQDKLNAGDATISAFSLESGKQATPAKITVVSATEVKNLSISNGPKTIVAGELAELSYSATDADGKPVTDFDTLNRVTLNGGKAINGKKGLRFEKKDGKVVLLYQPEHDTLDRATTEFISYITQTNNVGNAMLTVNPARIPTKIVGLKKDAATSVTVASNGAPLTIKATDLEIKDQYGDTVEIKNFNKGYALKVAVDDVNDDKAFSTCGAVIPAATTPAKKVPVASFGAAEIHANAVLDKNTEIVSASAVTPGSLKINLSVVDKDGKTVAGSEHSFNIHAVAASSLKDVKIEDIDLAQANMKNSAGQETTSKVAIKVTGMVDDKRVDLVAGRDYEIVAGTDKIPMDSTLTNGATEGKSTVSIIVMDGKGTRVNKEYTFSKKAPVVSSAELKTDGTVVESKDMVVGTATTKVVTGQSILEALDVKDQYGNKYSVASLAGIVYVKFSNLPEKANKADELKVERNGGNDATLSNFKTDDRVTVELSFAGSTYVFKKEIVLKLN